MNSLKVEQECIAVCIAALTKVAAYHQGQGPRGDSVAEAHTKHTVGRVLNYVVSFMDFMPVQEERKP